MSGRPSAAVERAKLQYGFEIKALRANKVRITREKRLTIIKDAAVIAGIHYTTLARALGVYNNEGKANGHGRRTARKRG